MDFLSSLLKNSGSESSLSSGLGAWRRAVSRLLDAMSPEYVIAYRAGAAQAIGDLSATTPLILDTISASQGVAYNVATGAFTLKPNTLYELNFYALFRDFNAEATDYAVVAWQDADGNPLVSGTVAFCIPPGSGLNIAPQPVARLIYSSRVEVRVRAVATAGSGAGSMGRSYAIVRKLGSTV